LDFLLVHRAFWADEVMAGLRHDLSNTLTVLGAALFRLRQSLAGLPPGAEPEDLSAVLARTQEQMSRAVEGISRSFAPPLDEAPATDVVRCVRELVADLPLADRVTVSHGNPPGLAAVPPAELKAALLCLVENACEAVALQPRKFVEIRSFRTVGGGGGGGAGKRPSVVIEVLDNGFGVEPAVLERVFDRFFTTKDRHVGLGLNVARAIVAARGGTVELASNRRGPGARATLLLPSAPAPSARR
jgi:signal transduction histidine kinase